jgi:hypothetical protein
LHDLLASIEASPLGRMMRESGPWTYAVVNLAHILGIASLFGAILVLDLRLLGVGRNRPFAPRPTPARWRKLVSRSPR